MARIHKGETDGKTTIDLGPALIFSKLLDCIGIEKKLEILVICKFINSYCQKNSQTIGQ